MTRSVLLSVLVCGLALAQTRTLYVFPGTGPQAAFGQRLDRIADADGDGIPDVVASAPTPATFAGTNYLPGYVRVYSGADGSLLSQVTSPINQDQFGASLAATGDLDGDQLGDYAVTGSGLWAPLEFRSGLTGQLIGILPGSEASQVAGLGDVDGDQTDDVIISLFGIAGGPVEVRVVSGATAQTIYTYPMRAPTLADVGDVDADGVPDFAYGNSRYNTSPLMIQTGAVFVHSGSDGSLIHSFMGEDANDRLGISVDAAGDLDGDGHEDIVVGMPGDATPFPSAGAVRVYSGADGTILHQVFGAAANEMLGCRVLGGHDLNGDGTPDFAALGSQFFRAFSGTNGEVLATEAPLMTNHIDVCSLTVLGDVDGDGLAEFAIGETDQTSSPGRVLVMSIGAASPFGLGLGGANTLSLEWLPGLTAPAAGTIRASGASPLAPGVFGFSLQETSTSVSGITLLINLAPGAFISTLPVAFGLNGRFAVPFDLRVPGLEGNAFFMQAAEFSTAAPQGVFASNGLSFFLTR